MAFFDDLSKKISAVSQTTIQKTKDFADTTKINTMITEETKKLKVAYCKIGKLYADTCIEPTGDYVELIKAVRESENKIKNYHKQIQVLKSMKKCVNCGADVLKESKFCSACGKSADKKEVPVPTNSTVCSACGRYVENGMKFCTFCGNPIGTPMSAQDVNVYEDIFSVSNQIPVKAAVNKCSVCGNELEADDAFCVNCGTRLN